ncbi:hypothetical protein Q6328_00485 [Klebsiella quasipneumoniae]|uniref:hypothetical protein n=1 Tax=Klebsiella quasipneumoniae TaxID=1463165 RepID=UPI00273090BA|nr:hypothetical protein [Klebsiella quasipneumoniae]MDP1255353.1 hypothetical protein [Klebsiella quasipneumoniae]
MPNVLDLQGLPENVQAMADKIANGACISLVSLVGVETTSTHIPSTELQVDESSAATSTSENQTMGACISLVSYVGRGSI